MSHNCSALIIHCIDFRLAPAIADFLHERQLMGDCDRVALAGAAKSFEDDDEVRVLLKQIQISSDLHQISSVVVMNHTDCGAYGGRLAFESREHEDNTHALALAHAEAVITEHFPHLEVVKMIAQIEPDGSVRMEEVIE